MRVNAIITDNYQLKDGDISKLADALLREGSRILYEQKIGCRAFSCLNPCSVRSINEKMCRLLTSRTTLR